MIETEKLTFKRMCMTIGNLPASYVDSMSYYECLLWLCNYLQETVIPTVNNNAEAVTELQGLFTELQTYVENYFDNLDVQDEVNNKLDEMAESGELEDIIASYLNTKTFLGFNTLNDLINADNIRNGSYCKTLGKNVYNDELGAFYFIRTITSDDVVDGDNIVALNISNTLIAEKIINYNEREKVIMLGDSYGATAGGWTYRLKELLLNNKKIRSSDVYIYNISGASAINDSSYLNQLINNANNIPDNYKHLVKKIILCGGYNDASVSPSGDKTSTELVQEGLEDMITYAKQHYPNAKIYLGCIAGNGNESGNTYNYTINTIALRAYKNACINTGALYLNGVEALMRRYDLYDSDNIHPNDLGDEILANGIYSSLYTGNINYLDYYFNDNLDLVSGINNNTDNTNKLPLVMNVLNDEISIYMSEKRFIWSSPVTVNTDFRQTFHLSDSFPLYIHAQNIFTVIPIICKAHYNNGAGSTSNELCTGYLQVTTNGVDAIINKQQRDTSYGLEWLYICIPNYIKKRIDC